MDYSILVNGIIAFGTMYVLYQNRKFRTEKQLGEGCRERHTLIKETINTVNDHKVKLETTKIKLENVNSDLSEIKNDIKAIYSAINSLKDIIINNNNKD